MIRPEMLHEAHMAISNAGPGQKSAQAQRSAELLGVTMQTLYRQLRKSGYALSERKPRADRGAIKVGISEKDIKAVAALMSTSRRNQGRIIMPAEVAIEIAEANGMIPPGQLSADTLNRHLRRMEADKRSLLAQDPHTTLRSLHPNHVHQLDYSVGIQWYLDKKGLGEHNMATDNYKNKPDHLAELVAVGKPKLIRSVLTDHFTGLIFMRFYYIPGESAQMAIDFLARAWRPKTDGNPFHGVPFVLMIDKTGAHRDTGFIEFCDALDVKLLDHAAGRSNVNGQVECAHRIVEQRIEARLRISPAKSLDELNEVAALECRKLNATIQHSRHKSTRAGLWQTIQPEHLRIIRAEHAEVLALANKQSKSPTVRGDYSVSFEGGTYKVFGIPGIRPRMKLEARRNVFDTDAIQIRVSPDEPWIEVRREQRLPNSQGAFPSLAPIIGEAYQAVPETTSMQHGKEFARIAYGADTDREAENARKRREKPFAGVDAFKSSRDFMQPEYMRRRGTDMPIAAAPELAPMPLMRAIGVISKRLGRAITAEENQAIRADFQNGMTEDQIETWLAGSEQKPRLRAVGSE